MCIVLLTTAHPRYALIALDNRDEFILRPTSRPHWWTAEPATPGPAPPHGAATTAPESAAEPQHILASRDLHRVEQGTWLGVTRAGHFAVLTNYREIDPVTGAPSVMGTKSRGGMATAWLSAQRDQSVAGFVETMISEGGTQGVGGFSLICGKLRRRRLGEMAPLAILSNKAAHPEQIPWIVGERGKTIGLSNAAWDGPLEWPKVTKGKALLEKIIAKAVEENWSEGVLQEELFGLLDKDDLPRSSEMKFEDYFKVLHESILIPPLGHTETHDSEAHDAQRDGTPQPFNTGIYGTQRQTVMLLDWDGNVTFTERALFDGQGKVIEKGNGDATFRFTVEGWDEL